MKQALWQRYQDWLYYHPGLDFYLDLSRVDSLTDELFQDLQPKFARAFQDMAALEAGSIANPDENRMVGHYWLRDPDLAPTPEIQRAIRESVERVERFAEQVHRGDIRAVNGEKFTDIVSIGIGGSALGPQFVSQAVAPVHPPLDIHFIDNTDPAGIDRLVQQLGNRLQTSLILVISKSGSTPEPRNGMWEIQRVFRERGWPFAPQAVAITMPGSELDQTAQREQWLARFPMFDWVGGRTSELATVGLVPAALQGIPIREMLRGAREMDQVTRIHDVRQNPAALLALAWYAIGRGRGLKDMVVLPYKDSLGLLSRYLQQLVMESLGKEKDLDGNIVNQGLTVYGNKGSTDQHAYVQQLREGLNNFFVTFIEVLRDRESGDWEIEPGITTGDYLSGFLQGTRQALYEKGRESITITIREVTPKTVAALIALYERAVGLYASLINVNAYHQPGVEAGKKAASAILQLQRQLLKTLRDYPNGLTLAEIAQKVQAPDEIETIYKILRHLEANKRGVEFIGDRQKLTGLIVRWCG
ncbi:MAG: glucose-6-phosphate isomerase [Gloeomargarita sp. SKYBB_i_bin120]|nr:glucose-6-phosphate isomerase [Gloeomargarita sp. SKYB120]MDW8178993.1 glucose-6-phosphate isomerase [Gloeomargarita sp. SKYBB_i_bin120]